MKHISNFKVLAIAAVIAAQSSTALADPENRFRINATGSGNITDISASINTRNTVYINQVGNNNVSTAILEGQANFVRFTGTGSRNQFSTFVNGSNNSVHVDAGNTGSSSAFTGSAIHDSTIVGNANFVKTKYGYNSGGSKSEFIINGNENVISETLLNKNEVSYEVFGNKNSISARFSKGPGVITVAGNNNSMLINNNGLYFEANQAGNRNSLYAKVTSGNATKLNQIGDDNKMTLTKSASFSEFTQLGNGNRLDITQHGFYTTHANFVQEGNNNVTRLSY